MSCGDIFRHNNNLYLQLGECDSKSCAPFVLLTEEIYVDAVSICGCDQFSPYFFVRRKIDGNFPDKNYFINLFGERILPLNHFNNPVDAFKDVRMKEIQECAKRHKMLQPSSYAYLNL